MGEPAAVPSELELVCGAFGPNASASRVPVHGAGFTGGMKRFPPLVDAPYGMPLNTLTPSMTTPRTFPVEVSPIALSRSAALANCNHGASWAPARKRPACFMKLRRLEMCDTSYLPGLGGALKGVPQSFEVLRRVIPSSCKNYYVNACSMQCSVG